MTAGIARRAHSQASVCQEFVDGLLTDYMEGALTAAARGRVERHLGSCRGCATLLHQQQQLVGLLRAMGRLQQ